MGRLLLLASGRGLSTAQEGREGVRFSALTYGCGVEDRGGGVLGHRGDELDDPVTASLRGAHAHLALRRGRVARYRADVAPFAALPADADEADWADLAVLSAPPSLDAPTPSTAAGGDGGGADVLVMGSPRHVPDGWLRVGDPVPGVQMVDVAVEADGPGGPGGPVTLGPGDIDDMLALARTTRPGPFERGTPATGRYLGIRREGVLVAMAGERLRPSGWVEVSAVCTHPSVRGQGLGTAAVRAVVAGIRADGGRALLHVGDDSPAQRLYERLGFVVRRGVELHRLRPPAPTGDGEGTAHGHRDADADADAEPRRG